MPHDRLSRRLLLAAAASATAFIALPASAGGLLDGASSPATSGPVKAMGGNLRPFYGNLRPFGGNLRPFYGNLRPFWGNLRPFWGESGAFYGDLGAFWGTADPAIRSAGGAPAYARIADFWTVQGAAYDTTLNGWSDDAVTADRLKTLVYASSEFWGSAVRAQTGKSFEEGFARAVLAKHGLDLAAPTSLGGLDQTQRALFFLDWYDGLMRFAGTDHVDHWMRTVNWSPALTQIQSNAGQAVRVGILDQSLNDLERRQVVAFKGSSTFTDGHGDAVASILVGAHDGKGVMGVAPNARVYAYNPFDTSGSAGWDDVSEGIRKLKASGASVINASLGVPGMTFDPGWNRVFGSLQTAAILKSTVFVVAAGNEGVTQTQNIDWLASNPAVIVVGSVDLNGDISTFSNRPGEACLSTPGLGCLAGQKLKDRYIVAPGEMILVSDGEGGVTRQIGTSFAAPMVSGAIALIHDRWPWLKNFPQETADIILRSAKDLGAPGADPVYGRGLLDIEASQSPLDFNSLVWFTVENGKPKLQSAAQVLSAYQAEQRKTWSAQGAYFYAFEPLGLLTSRDFAIPLAQKLVGQNVTTSNGAREQFQAYLLGRMDDWAAAAGRFQTSGAANAALSTAPVRLANPWGADLSVSFAPRQVRQGFRDEGPAYQTTFRITGEQSVVSAGFGNGGAALVNAATGFAQAGDYDTDRGGVNPLLGLAAGGGFAAWSFEPVTGLQVTAGALTRDQRRDPRSTPALGVVGNGAERYDADAQIVTVAGALSATVTVSGGYTRLSEGRGLLGIQSLDPADFRGGAITDGYTASVRWAASDRLALMASGTYGRTRAGGGEALSVARQGLTSSAFQVGLARTDLFAGGDRLQITLSQPMFVERGKLDFATVRVIDRDTGAIGVETQQIDIAGKRRVAAEALYLRPIEGGFGQLAVYGRAETRPGETGEAFTTGALYRVAF